VGDKGEEKGGGEEDEEYGLEIDTFRRVI